VQTLQAAAREPVTHARASDQTVVERYGTGQNVTLHFTVLCSHGDGAVPSELRIDLDAITLTGLASITPAGL